MTSSHGQVQYGDTVLNFRILRKPTRKTIEIRVDPDATITVSVPKGTFTSKIVEMVRSKADWIIGKQWALSRLRKGADRSFISGESYFYLGRQYQMKVVQVQQRDLAPEFTFRNGMFMATVPASWSQERKIQSVRSLLTDWYKDRSRVKIQEIMKKYARFTGLQPSSLIITEMKQRWGSCSRNGTLRINWRIIMASSSLVEYVVAHEVCHLAHSDHSVPFWKTLESVMPDFAARRDLLARDGGRYVL